MKEVKKEENQKTVYFQNGLKKQKYEIYLK